MKKEERRFLALDIVAIIKKRLWLLLLSVFPLGLFLIGGYLLTQPVTRSGLDRNLMGLILAVIGIILLVIIWTLDAVRTFKRWEIVEKQKAYAAQQKYPKFNEWLFFLIVLVFVLVVLTRGAEGYYKLNYYVRLALWIALIWSSGVLLLRRFRVIKK